MGNGTALSIKNRIEALRNTPAEKRGNAAYSLEHKADVEALPVLAEALKDEDPFIRESALYALDWYDKEPIEAGIMAVLAGDEDANVREAAALALAPCSLNAVPVLVGALSDPVAAVREQAARSLGRLEARDAVAALAGALEKDDNVDVRACAAIALGEIGGDAVLAHLIAGACDSSQIVRKHAAYALGETRHEQALSYLAAMLKDAYAEVREWAARALDSITGLGEVRDPKILMPLCEALHDNDTRVRECLIGALGNLQDKRAMPLLVKALEEDEGEIRAAAVKAIASIDRMGGLEHLVNALGDKDVDVRRSAAAELEFIEFHASLSSGTKQRLFSIVSDPGADFVVRCSLAEGLSGDRDAVPVLIEVLQDGSEWVREAAAKALANTRDPRAFKPLMAALDDPEEIVRGASALALAALGDGAAVPALSRILNSGDSPYVRRRVVWALSFFDHPDVPELLSRSLQDEDPHVRETAAEALEALGRNEPRPVRLGTVHYE